jgi:hypothetical protein
MEKETITIITVIGVVLSSLISLLVVFLVRRSRSVETGGGGFDARDATSTVDGFGQTSGVGEYEGVAYTFRTWRQKNRGKMLRLVVPVAYKGSFEIAPENGAIRFLKAIGLLSEERAGDRIFDERFLLLSDPPGSLRSILLDARLRAVFTDVADTGVERMVCAGGALTVEYANIGAHEAGRLDRMVKAALVGMGRIAESLPSLAPGVGRAHGSAKAAVALIGFPILVTAVGAGLFIAAQVSYPPLDPWRFAGIVAAVSLPVALAYAFYAARRLAGRPNSVGFVIAAAVIAVTGFPMGGLGFCEWYNGVFDRGAGVSRDTVVIERIFERNDKSTNYYALVAGWREGETTEKIAIDRSTYDRIEPGKTHAKITTRPGALGYAWVVEATFAVTTDSRETP